MSSVCLAVGEYLSSHGRGVCGVSGLRCVSAPPQHPGLLRRVQLLPQHLSDCPQSVINASPRWHTRGQAHGHPHLHRLHLHGSHLFFRHLSRPQAASHHCLGIQAPASSLLPNKLVLKPLPVCLFYPHLQAGLLYPLGPIRHVQDTSADLQDREFFLSAAGMDLSKEQSCGAVLLGQCIKLRCKIRKLTVIQQEGGGWTPRDAA